MVEETAYVYKPLPTDNHHIRLLEILPGQENDRIRLSISHASLGNGLGTYDALSYMWGPPQPTYRVWVDDQFLVIRENLWRFLNHHRKSHTGDKLPLLWTDSICINQDDLEEKGRQVQGMDKVYSNAQRVLIWLGEIYRNQLDHDYLTANSLFSEQDEFSPEEKESAERLCACALNVVNHQYWLRLWIVQEVVLAKGNAHIIQGPILLSSELFGIMSNVDESGVDCTGDAFTSFSELVRAREAKSETAVFSDACLTSLLTRFNKQRCENLRDRIYGMLGLLNPDVPAARIHVDYKINIWVLFLQVFDLLLEERYKPGLDADVSTISQLKLAARTFDLHTQDILSAVQQTMQQCPELSFDVPVLSCEFRQWSDSGLLDLSLLKTLSQCELSLPFSDTNCHLLPVSQSSRKVVKHYRLVVNHSKPVTGTRVVPRYQPSDHLHPFQTLRRRCWIYALDKDLSIGLQFFARGKVQILGYVDAVEGLNNLYKITSLPTGLQGKLDEQVNGNIVFETKRASKHRAIKLSLSVLVVMQLILRQVPESV